MCQGLFVSRREILTATHASGESIVLRIGTGRTIGVDRPAHMRRTFTTEEQSARVREVRNIDYYRLHSL